MIEWVTFFVLFHIDNIYHALAHRGRENVFFYHFCFHCPKWFNNNTHGTRDREKESTENMTKWYYVTLVDKNSFLHFELSWNEFVVAIVMLVHYYEIYHTHTHKSIDRQLINYNRILHTKKTKRKEKKIKSLSLLVCRSDLLNLKIRLFFLILHNHIFVSKKKRKKKSQPKNQIFTPQ